VRSGAADDIRPAPKPAPQPVVVTPITPQAA
jgi:hypothetical protein